MKKKFFIGIAAVAVAAVATVNVNYALQDKELSEFALANVEALADENSECPNGCYDNGNGCFCYVWYPCYREAK